MDPLRVVDIFFQLIVFLFAISLHESAHAWMANRCGDPTARMLGRITLNPLKHIDPVGTVLLPLISMATHLPAFGWAKPTPVDPHNFKNPVLDDIKTSVVGPVSNFLIACVALTLLLVVSMISATGREIVRILPYAYRMGVLDLGSSPFVPLVLMLYQFMWINLVLGVFNLIPVPPLDGSHVLRHFLPDSARRAYDAFGVFGLIALVFAGGRLLGGLFGPVIGLFNSIAMRL